MCYDSSPVSMPLVSKSVTVHIFHLSCGDGKKLKLKLKHLLTIKVQYIHAGVKARSILLVLQAGLGQVNGKHTGHSNQASDPPIDQFGRQTGRRG